jgi:flagellar basal-body rod protein FlgG
MMRALWSAATGMSSKQLAMDVIANNLSNVNTTGFKKSRVDFQDLMYQTLRLAGGTSARGSNVPTGIQVGLGNRTSAITKTFSQGDFVQTDNPTDLVIEGDGFFRVILPDGTYAYTRDGSFKIDSESRLVTSDGYLVDPEINFDSDVINISIGTDGTVSVVRAGSDEPEVIGEILLVKFMSPSGLMSVGRNLYKATVGSGEPVEGTPGMDGFGTIAQGFLEMSNVKVVDEMVNMIIAQRAYEVNSKAIQTADDMLGTANNLKR